MAGQDKNSNKGGDDRGGNAMAIMVMVISFGSLLVISIMTKEHPFDFIANFLGMLVAYLFLIALAAIIIGVVFFYYRIADEDPDKPFKDRARDTLEISKETSSEISKFIKRFYADYQDRKKVADDDQNNTHHNE